MNIGLIDVDCTSYPNVVGFRLDLIPHTAINRRADK